MNEFKRVYANDNLARAWRWILSNPDYRYKSYFREAYIAYNLAEDENIRDLKRRIKNGLYIIGMPSKIYLPKKSGMLRPYTLISVEDQVVYQAYINIIAEALTQKIKHRQYKIVFSNIYAGIRSIWFYKKWDKGYRALNSAIKASYKQGDTYTASFDLTSFYDSIDHEIIRHFLQTLKIDGDFIDGLLEFLKRMSTNSDIMKTNGIPQGPLASGLLSELILSYIDEKAEHKIIKDDVLYFRYVDDIKLMSKNPMKLQKALSVLDYYCKQIGLYPQTSKIEIHRISSIEEEIKNISGFNYESKIDKKLKQVNSAIFKLIKNNQILNETKFKIYLANAHSDSRLACKLIGLLPHNIDLIDNIGRYLENYTRKIPAKVFECISDFLKSEEIFQYLNGVLVKSIRNRLRSSDYSFLVDFLLKRYKNRNKSKLVPSYKAEILSVLIANNKIAYRSIQKLLRDEKDFTVIKSILDCVNIDIIGEASYIDLLKICLKRDEKDSALLAAYLIIQKNLKVEFDLTGVNVSAQITLRVSNKINRVKAAKSVIPECLKKICEVSTDFGAINWERLFGSEHDIVQQQMLTASAYAKTDITAFVNIIDVFNDLFIHKLSLADITIGTCQLGNIGGFLNPGSAFQIKYPQIHKMCSELHKKRAESYLSHPLVRGTNKFTNRIEYKYIYTARKLLLAAFSELLSKSPV